MPLSPRRGGFLSIPSCPPIATITAPPLTRETTSIQEPRAVLTSRSHCTSCMPTNLEAAAESSILLIIAHRSRRHRAPSQPPSPLCEEVSSIQQTMVEHRDQAPVDAIHVSARIEQEHLCWWSSWLVAHLIHCRPCTGTCQSSAQRHRAFPEHNSLRHHGRQLVQ